MAGEPNLTPPDGLGSGLGSSMRRNLSDGRSRLILVAAGLAVLILGAGFLFLSGSSAPPPQSALPEAPKLDSTPAGSQQQQSPYYTQLQMRENAARADAAERRGGSAIATIVADPPKPAEPPKPKEPAPPPPPPPAEEPEALPPPVLQAAPPPARPEAAPVPVPAPPPAPRAPAIDYGSAVSAQVSLLLGQWVLDRPSILQGRPVQAASGQPGAGASTSAQPAAGTTPAAASMTAPAAGQTATGQTAPGASVGGSAATGPVLIPGGMVLYATMLTSVDSRSPGPIMAEIHGGPFDGARLLGSFTQGKDADGLTITFTSMTVPTVPGRPIGPGSRMMTVSAVAVDATTNRTSIATDVDRHLFERYALKLAAAFIQGFAAVAATGNTVVTQSPFGGTTTQRLGTSTRDAIYGAAGQVGQTLAQDLDQANQNRPPTITIESGHGVGVLFLQELRG